MTALSSSAAATSSRSEVFLPETYRSETKMTSLYGGNDGLVHFDLFDFSLLGCSFYIDLINSRVIFGVRPPL